MKIVLDTVEETIRSLLLQFSSEFVRQGHRPVTLRFAGGWVRDKLLGRASHDIDVAIDTATGQEFAEALQIYLAKNEGREVKHVHKIAINPEKSKHLETATTKICGLDIDFVNLRSETYAENSRIPTVEYGTPKEDALRRDATLNALFYNLTTSLVEDWTGQGLNDLKLGILRTPLDPYVTFNDDPLRVLRLVRFCGQLGFTLAEETAAAMKCPEIGQAIRTKVSSERLGTEIQKLVDSPHAVNGLKYVATLGLAPYVFALPPGLPQLNRLADWSHNLATNLVYANDEVLPKLTGRLKPETASARGQLWLSLVLQNWSHLTISRGPRPGLAHQAMMRDGIKLLRKTRDAVSTILETTPPSASATRIELGQYVRKAGELWPLCLAYSACATIPDTLDVATAEIIAHRIEEEGLDAAYALKPLLDGKQIMSLFPNRKSGPWIGQATEAIIDFQLEHPDADIKDVKAYLQEAISD